MKDAGIGISGLSRKLQWLQSGYRNNIGGARRGCFRRHTRVAVKTLFGAVFMGKSGEDFVLRAEPSTCLWSAVIWRLRLTVLLGEVAKRRQQQSKAAYNGINSRTEKD